MSNPIYARLGVGLITHHRAIRVGPQAMGVYTYCVLYTRAEELDGFIPEEAARYGWNPGGDNLPQLDRLVSAGLLILAPGGYRVTKYELFNDTSETMEENRRSARERMRAVRANNRRTFTERSPDVPTSTSKNLSLLGGEGEPERENPTAEPEPAKARGVSERELAYRTAFCEGIAHGKGSGFAWPDGFNDQGTLNLAIQTFAKDSKGPYRGEGLLRWIHDAAHDFARWVLDTNQDPRFWAHFGPKGFLKFLNQEVRQQEARKHG